MIIIMQGNVLDIIINILHDMISAHILHVATFIGYNRMLTVLKIGTVYVTFWWLLFSNITISHTLSILHLQKMSQWEQYTKQKL